MYSYYIFYDFLFFIYYFSDVMIIIKKQHGKREMCGNRDELIIL